MIAAIPAIRRRPARWLAALAGLATASAMAADPPQLGARGLADYGRYRASAPHRAFVIAPGGAWAWRIDEPSPAVALDAALAACRAATPQTCVPYAVDDEVVFDAAAWSGLWGPYADRAAAARAPVGVRRGERFPDLALVAPGGRAQTIAGLRGRVAVLHFWGSWCAPCRKEMPELARTRARLAGERDIAFVLIQVREPVAAARRWMAQQRLELPVFDSGSRGDTDAELRLADGTRLPDRSLARVFPSTYVIDRHGLVLFAHVGPIPRWSDYEPFLRDAAARSGR